LEFNSGAIYRHFEFPPHQYAEFLAAGSQADISTSTFWTDFVQRSYTRLAQVIEPPEPKTHHNICG
jgi:KTSC domain